MNFTQAQTNGWEKVDDGIVGPIVSFYSNFEEDSTLYVGGQFEYCVPNGPWPLEICQRSITAIKDNEFILIPSGTPFWGNVHRITNYKNDIYIGLSSGGQRSLFHLDKINSTWIDLSDSLFDYQGQIGGGVRGLELYNGELLIGGSFLKLNQDTVFGTVLWDGVKFKPFWNYTPESGMIQFILNDIAVYKGEVYAAGSFIVSPYGNGLSLIKFNGEKWVPVGVPYMLGNTASYALEVYNNELYVGGFIKKADGYAGNYIMRWNGTSWNELGTSVNAPVLDMIVYNNDLYVCGIFTHAGGENAMYIARWDGSQWHKIDDSVFDWNFNINTMVVHDEYLYIACGPTINGDTFNRIARRYVGPKNTDDIEDIINIYPNPMAEQLTLEYDLDKVSDFKFALYDVVGNIVYEEQNSNVYGYYYYSIPTVNLAAGLYIARVELNGKTISKKIIKN
ncbi:MAG: T9SS type A sorting domain-containing protein [Sphingobacteriales bacterium JAD_PAG50586_3]|nr:MAG: T9SS type A sorting domain-containing protein [Sphingobacteriales bacterium JAD_PAG50586_3]